MARGGKREGAGRPAGSKSRWRKPESEHKNGRVVLACTEDEAARIKELAAKSGKTISRFVVDAVLNGDKKRTCA
jgi:hypothetical protein